MNIVKEAGIHNAQVELLAARDAALAAKDPEIASLRTRLDASSQREGDLLQRAANNLRVANEVADRMDELLQICLEKNRRIADLEEQCDRLIHSPVQNELTAIHAAHRAAVVRCSDAEAVIKSYQHEVSCHRKAAELHVSEITTLKQCNETQAESIRAYRTENKALKQEKSKLLVEIENVTYWKTAHAKVCIELKESEAKLAAARGFIPDYSATELKRLKHRVNDLVCILDQIRNQTSHAQREIL